MTFWIYVLVMVIVFTLDNIAIPLNAHFGRKVGNYWALSVFFGCGAVIIPIGMMLVGAPLITLSFFKLPWFVFTWV